jgi:Zn-dependent peptidase ImmA (M78 family)
MTLSDDEDFEAAARNLRIKLGIDDQLRPDMTTVIIKLKHCGIIDDYLRVPDDQMPNDEAYFDSKKRLLCLRESTFCAASAMYTFTEIERRRARYTIAHEIGHIALGHDGVRYRGQTSKLSKELMGRIARQEREAERFAAAFLVPQHLVLTSP